MTLHVVGAGLAGLACAVAAADAGLDVALHEATRLAGGRCRSWDDAVIGRRIDNGTHVIAGGNRSAKAYLRRIGSLGTLRALPGVPPVLDLASGKTWRATPLRLLQAYAGSLWRLGVDDRGTVAERLRGIAAYRELWEPLAVAALNTDAALGSAALFRAALAETIWRGPLAGRLHVVRESLAATFIAPALKALAARGAEIRLGRPLRGMARRDAKVAELEFDGASVTLSRHDAVVLAVPWWIASRFLGLPELPDSPIVNVHYVLEAPPLRLADDHALSLVGGAAQWIFRRGNILSVHVSAAAGLDARDNDEVADTLWKDTEAALGLGAPPVAVRVVKERRATLLHTPETEEKRPHRRQGENILLAGDWTATGLPCTIEGAIRSGHAAAADAVAMLRDGN